MQNIKVAHHRDQLKVLIVDDAPSIVRIISESIKLLAKIIVAKDGGRALSLVKHERPDLVLLDIQMPHLNGLDVCKAIKSDPEIWDTRIMFVTAESHPETELEALGLGGIDFISKPINSAILRTRVQSQLIAIKRTKELIDARNELHGLISTLPVFVSYWSRELINTYSNDCEGKWFSLKPHELSNLFLSTLFEPDVYEALQPNIDKVLRGQNNITEVVLSPFNGAKRYAQLSFINKPLFDGVEGFILVISDVTERKVSELKLLEDKDNIDITLRSIGDGVIATDLEGKVTFINPVAEHITGYLDDSAAGLEIETVMQLRDAFTQETVVNPVRLAIKENRVVEMPLDTTMQTKQGELLYIEDSAAPITNKEGALVGAILVFHDVSQQKAASQRMVKLATEDSLTELPNRVLLLDRTQQAINNDEIAVYFQAKVEGISGNTVGAEALVRWPQADGSMHYPDSFIPLAESSKLIIPLGKQVLTKSCQQLVKWQEIDKNMSISVNISAIQFKPSLVETIKQLLNEFAISPASLELEITESVLINDAQAIDTFVQLKALGIKLCLDDFGKGFSSLSYIREYPLDVLKIDQSFVRNMFNDKKDLYICKTIIDLANNLDLKLVAEGVETQAHADKLLEMGCTLFQGYFYSKAIPASQISARLS